MGIYLIEIEVPTKSVLHTGQPFMYSRYGSKGDIFPPLANNRITVGYPVLLEGSLLHPGFSRMYGPGKFNTAARPYSMQRQPRRTFTNQRNPNPYQTV